MGASCVRILNISQEHNQVQCTESTKENGDCFKGDNSKLSCLPSEKGSILKVKNLLLLAFSGV